MVDMMTSVRYPITRLVIKTLPFLGYSKPGTGIAPSIAALMLYSGDIRVKGVTAPEGCIDPDRYLKALRERGARIYQTETLASVLGF